jgi:polysaccharide deacetylase family protein (PEP-CTERM system associated)
VSQPLAPTRPQHIATVVVEDYFHHTGLRHLIAPGRWSRFEARIERNVEAALDLLDRHGLQVTFFVLGWVADRRPELVREIARRGHEIATKGYWHRALHEMTPSELRDDVRRSRELLESITGRRVWGHRIAEGSFGPSDRWALEVLAEEGFAYDSSVYPRLRQFSGEPWRRLPHRLTVGAHEIWEVPLASLPVAGLDWPLAGGNFLRQLPYGLAARAVQIWERRVGAPFVLYFHVWELDPALPRISAPGVFTRIRQYRNLERMPDLLDHLLREHAFVGIAEHLGLERDASAPARAHPGPLAERAVATPIAPTAEPTPITVVVPCYNEELVLPYLANTLRSVEEELGDRWALRFVFVDDGSADETPRLLGELFGSRADCQVVRHAKNRGVAAAIQTGIRHAHTEIVCSIDCDCTYDPHQLEALIPHLEVGVDLVTASPYHPQGRVLNVPAWRLTLSKSLSFLYRRVLHQKLRTYTSCFRVYRRAAVADLPLSEDGFLGVAEMLALLDLRGARIVECPAILEVRMLGRSKLKTARTIAGHLRLLLRLASLRLIPGSAKPAAERTPE